MTGKELKSRPMTDDKNKNKKHLKQFGANTPRKRMMKLAGMSTSIATKAASNAIKSPFQSKEQRTENREKLLTDIGLQVAQTLGEMKGAVMKVGQVASQIKDLLPDELALALEKLQKDSPPMPFSLIKEQLIAELGEDPEQLFKHFDKEPFAAASIGQVHRATTKDDQEVVVKIQYPGVDKSCESDLKQLRLLLKLGGLIKVEKYLLDEIFDEIRQQLHQELDYENEANNLTYFYNFHKNDSEIVIPQVIKKYSTKKILTLQYEPGDKLDDLTNIPAYSQGIRNQIGHNLFSMIIRQVYELKTIHADPHPGNFAFRPDGTVIVYDFGAVKNLSDNIIQSLSELTDIAFSSRYHEVDDLLLKIGARKKRH